MMPPHEEGLRLTYLAVASRGFEEGEFDGNSATEEVAAQIYPRWADAVQLGVHPAAAAPRA
jgi:hypothetical protein